MGKYVSDPRGRVGNLYSANFDNFARGALEEREDLYRSYRVVEAVRVSKGLRNVCCRQLDGYPSHPAIESMDGLY